MIIVPTNEMFMRVPQMLTRTFGQQLWQLICQLALSSYILGYHWVLIKLSWFHILLLICQLALSSYILALVQHNITDAILKSCMCSKL